MVAAGIKGELKAVVKAVKRSRAVSANGIIPMIRMIPTMALWVRSLLR
jgi:hypothetical protein